MAKSVVKTTSKSVAAAIGTVATVKAKDEAARKAAGDKSLTFDRSDMKPLDFTSADAAIADIRAAGISLRRQAHITACGILLHWQAHGDWTKLVPLASAIGESMASAMRARFIEWVCMFTNLTWDEKANDGKGNFKSPKKGTAPMFRLEDEGEGDKKMEGALNTPFWKFDREVKPRPFDFDKYMKDVVKRVHAELERKHKLESDKATKSFATKHIKIDDAAVAAIDRLAVELGIEVPTEGEATGGNSTEGLLPEGATVPVTPETPATEPATAG